MPGMSSCSKAANMDKWKYLTLVDPQGCPRLALGVGIGVHDSVTLDEDGSTMERKRGVLVG
jgi:hypothetical protein